MEKLKIKESKLVNEVYYDVENKKLVLFFKNQPTDKIVSYIYDDVELDIAYKFETTDSVGKYFLHKIKKNYSFTKEILEK